MSKIENGGLDQYGNSSNLEQLALKGLTSLQLLIGTQDRLTSQPNRQCNILETCLLTMLNTHISYVDSLDCHCSEYMAQCNKLVV